MGQGSWYKVLWMEVVYTCDPALREGRGRVKDSSFLLETPMRKTCENIRDKVYSVDSFEFMTVNVI